MLVTFSGMVGSGKTTNAKKALQILHEIGYSPYYLRFRLINWRDLFKSPAAKPWQPREKKGSLLKTVTKPPGFIGIFSKDESFSSLDFPKSQHDMESETFIDEIKTLAKLKEKPTAHVPRQLNVTRRLTLLHFAGYLVRIVCFRLIVLLHYRNRLLIVNRYFYDNLSNYRVINKRDSWLLKILLGLIPKPKQAFWMIVDPYIAHERRPQYNVYELHLLANNYDNLRKYIRNLSTIYTTHLETVEFNMKENVLHVFGKNKARS